MRLTSMTATLATAGLALALAGCGTEPEVTEPADTSSVSATTSDAAPTTGAPTTEEPISAAPTDTSSPTSEPTSTSPGEPTEGADDLPTEPTAYSDAFLRVWRDGDADGLARFATDDALDSLMGFTPWEGAEWQLLNTEAIVVDGAARTLLTYTTDDNQLLAITVDDAVVEAGGEQGIIAADYSLGDYPIPTTVQDYSVAFVEAVMSGDEGFATRLGPADGFAGADLWSDLIYEMPTVEEVGGGEDLVTFPFQEGGRLEVTIDRATAQAGEAHAITSVVFHQQD